MKDTVIELMKADLEIATMIAKTAKSLNELTDRVVALEEQVRRLQGNPKIQANMHGEN